MLPVSLVNVMGDDMAVVNAARVSYGKWKPNAKPDRRDRALIKFMAEHNHWTPFGHAYATFRVTAPIFVARQLAKHQVGLVWNEVSRRYTSGDPEFFRPDVWRGKGGEAMADTHLTAQYRSALEASERCYRAFLDAGVTAEQARAVLPQAMLTTWIWSGTLMAWARVCKLRLDKHAQKETRDVAACFDQALALKFPVCWSALMGAEAEEEESDE